jgi:hypothetical protein
MLARRLRAIQGASRWLQALFILLAILFVINRIDALKQPSAADTRTLVGVVFHGAAITGKIQILWVAQLALGALLSLKVTYHLVRLSGSFSQGQVFTEQQVAQVRQVAVTLAFAPAIWLALLIGAWPEVFAAQDQWVKIMSSFPGDAIIGSCIVVFASRLMNEGRELRDEHDLVI